jgi:hypothetical protein
MSGPKPDVHDYEISNLINKLIRFLGRSEVERALKRYQLSLDSARPVFREYYLKNRHPWWGALIEFLEMNRSGLAIRRNLTERLKVLAGDAKKIGELQKTMPEGTKLKYRRNLIDDSRAYDYLFEIQIAWHFFLKGYTIEWYESDSKSHPEFLVKTPELEFDVECKRISVDASRRVRRRDFYRFAEKVVPEIENMGLLGRVDIVVKDRLRSSENFLETLAGQILDEVSSSRGKGEHQIELGRVYLDVEPAKNTVVDLQVRLKAMLERKPHQAHGAIFAKSLGGKPTEPVELTLMCDRPDMVLQGIREKIAKAAMQMDKSRPGLIACYLEGISALSELAEGSGLQLMTSLVLLKDSLSHIAAVSYSAETMMERHAGTETFFSPGLVFRNPSCHFDNIKDFRFLSEDARELQYRLSDILPSSTEHPGA